MNKHTGQPLQQGDKIGVFEIERVLVSDQIGFCYQALNHHLNERVALTEYFPNTIAVRDTDSNAVLPESKNRQVEYDEGLAAFIERAEAFSQVQHDNVLRIHNVLPFNETAYCVAELINENRIAVATTYSEAQLEDMFADLLGALKQIHKNGIVHGAIAPESINLRSDNTVLLTGIYLAFNAGCGKSAKTRAATDSVVDLEPYHDRDAVGPETDLYGLAATIYACYTHQEPAPMQTRLSVVSNNQPDPLPLISSLNEKHDGPAWTHLIDRMLLIAKQDRFATASEVLVELNRIKDEAQLDTGLEAAKAEDAKTRYRFLPYAAAVAVIALFLSITVGPFRKGQDDTGPTIAAEIPVVKAPVKQSESSASSNTDLDQSKAANFAALESDAKRNLESAKLQKPDRGDQANLEYTNADNIDQIATDHSMPDSTEMVVSEDGSTSGQIAEQPISSASFQPTIVAKLDNNLDRNNPIQSHLDAAKNDFKALRLTTPEGNNAYEHYAAVLSLDPQNQEALEGNERIVDVYVWLIGNAIQKGERKLAGVYLARADKVAAQNPSLESLRHDLTLTEN